MKKFTKLFSLSVLFAAVGSFALPASAEIAVIVNSSFNESVDADQVTKLFLGKDKSLTPIMAGGKASDEFIEKVYLTRLVSTKPIGQNWLSQAVDARRRR
ncbi:hypothetical protein CA267_000155 [Alteromonas pelagimontana]|uniref:Phosphate ABC transporter substrate-binding protein n=1 Tax=Alteromonas pelagimontana TaxID=1858656 RepID=A0A6M4M810_9ALTE|nr:hypothetical protein [Alteromonas pelagimontana]QJR79322.1 hypothetical protein CA267_000155 [Alteromonas pelagimontana]